MPDNGPALDRRHFLGTASASAAHITLDGNTVEGFAAKVDDRRK